MEDFLVIGGIVAISLPVLLPLLVLLLDLAVRSAVVLVPLAILVLLFG